MSRTLPLTSNKVKSFLLAASLVTATASLMFDVLFPTTHNPTFFGLALATVLWTIAFGFLAKPLDRKKRKNA